MKITHLKKLIAGSAIALGMSMVGGQEAQAATQTATLNISASVNATCTISASGLNFGVYSVTAATPNDISGSVTINCTSGAPVILDLDDGVNQDALSTPAAPIRNMSSLTVPSLLGYNLSATAAGGPEWGAGDPLGGGTGEASIGTGANQVFTVFGRIPELQAVLSGAYTDTVTATVNY